MKIKSKNKIEDRWRTDLELKDKSRNFTITLKKNGYDPYIDYLKGLCIFFVVLTHCLPKLNYILFSLWGAQAVPLFLLIQTFHAYKNGVDKAGRMPQFVKLFNRIFKPFIIFLFIELFLLIVIFKNDPLRIVKSAISSGGIGPGSYYVWIYIQFAFIIPVMAWVIKILKKYYREGQICLFMIAISSLLEFICVYTHIPEWFYRLLFFRYFFLIYLGYSWVEKGINLNRSTLLLSIVSITFILLFTYTSANFEPFFFKTDWKINHWISYFYVAYLFMFLLRFCYNFINETLKSFICLMGRYSYDIFLLQMFVFTFFPSERLLEIVGNKYVSLILTVIFTVSLSILPVILWKRWKEKSNLWFL